MAVWAISACQDGLPEAPTPLAETEVVREADEPRREDEAGNKAERWRSVPETSQAGRADNAQTVEPETEEGTEAEVQASALEDPRDQPTVAKDAQGVESDTETPEETANSEENSEAEESAQIARGREETLEVALPDGTPPIDLHAGPAVEWAVRTTITAPATFTVMGRERTSSYDPQFIWLLIELPDGTRGWIRASDLSLEFSQFAFLPVTDKQRSVRIANQVSSYDQPDTAARHCDISPGTIARIYERSPDAQWVFAYFDRPGCPLRNSGWLRVADLDWLPILIEAPILLSHGFWLIPTDPQLQPEQLPFSVIEGYGTEAWDLDPDDQSIVFIDDAIPYDDQPGQLRQFSLASGAITTLAQVHSREILVAPTGGRILTLSAGYQTPYAGRQLSIIERGGKRTDIGKLFLSHQTDNVYPLSQHATWSPDGRIIVFNDRVIPIWLDPDAYELWLYHVDEMRRVDLRDELVDPQSVTYHETVFHPHGQSFYLLERQLGPAPASLLRLTLDGETWPEYRPVPVFVREFGNGLSSTGDRMITEQGRTGFLLTEQGEQLGWRHGTQMHWLPGGERIAYFAEGEWIVEHLDTQELVRFKVLFDHQEEVIRPYWSPDARHFVAATFSGRWRNQRAAHLTGGHPRLRIHTADGDLVVAYRAAGCMRAEWLPDGTRLALSVFECFGGP